MTTRIEVGRTGDERTMLLEMLDHYRATLTCTPARTTRSGRG